MYLQMGQVVQGDLDGQPGNEYLISLRCETEGASNFNYLAVRPGPTGLKALGWVNLDAQGDLLTLDSNEPPMFANGAVYLNVLCKPDGGVCQSVDKQVRAYAYRGRRMTQVDGPTAFAAPPQDAASFDPANASLTLEVPFQQRANSTDTYVGVVRTFGGTGQAGFEKIVDSQSVGVVRVSVAVRRKLVVTTGDTQAAIVVVDVTPADGGTYTLVTAQGFGLFGYDEFLVTVAPGDTVTDVQAEPGRIRISMTVNGAATTRTYEYVNSQSQRWNFVG
jgi:hypothetical protein